MFVANGPSFKQGISADEFSNIEIYNLMAGESIFPFHLKEVMVHFRHNLLAVSNKVGLRYELAFVKKLFCGYFI